MSTQDILARIISDANTEADEIVKSAENRAQALGAEASAYAENARLEAERLAQEKTESILEKRAADARLECAKILLTEKRKTLEAVYELALQRLLALGKEDTLTLFSTLLDCYAEEGDEIRFSQNFRYVEDVTILPVMANKKLTVSSTCLPIEGGMYLTGKKSDKDLSYRALLSADKDGNLAELAKTLFGA